MKKLIRFISYILFITTILLITNITYCQQSNNNAFVFNGKDSRLYILDGQPVNSNARQNSFQYFNKINSINNNITIQAWIYLIGDSPNIKMPVIYRSVSGGGTSFSLYVQNNKGYFTVGNSTPVSTPAFPAFTWIQLTGMYDGQNLKIYYK